MLRKATASDTGRLSEIMVFNNRLYYYPIYRDIGYAFGKYTVEYLQGLFKEHPEVLDGCTVYEDTVIKGFVCVLGEEIFKLHVEPAFQNEGVGAILLEYAKTHTDARWLWVLEKNTRGIRFYERHGFTPTGEKQIVPGSEQYVIKMAWK